MPATPARQVLAVLVAIAALIPAAPALARTATPTVTIGPSATPTPTPPAGPAITGFAVTRSVIDFGQTVDATVRGTAGTAVKLSLINPRTVTARVIRTGTIGADGSFTWTGLRPEDTAQFQVQEGLVVLGADVQVRRTATIGVSQANGVYSFSGQLRRAEAGVQVTIARLDSETKRVTGVASTNTDAAGRYTIRTRLPQGFAGYYALTEAENGLEAGRSRLYGLIVTPRPGTASITITALFLDDLYVKNLYFFTGTVSGQPREVPVTLGRQMNGRLVGVRGGLTDSTGGYSLGVVLTPGIYVFQVVTATGRSPVCRLVVTALPSVARCS